MKYIFTCFLFICGIFISYFSSAQVWQWAKGNTGAGSSEIDAWPVTTDIHGNVYAGLLNSGAGSSVVLDTYSIPLLGTQNGPQTIIVKYGPSGNVLWANGSQYGSSWLMNIATDNAGNLYVLGTFNSDSIQIGNHTLINGPNSLGSYYLAKYDPAGNVIWAKNYAGFYNGSGDICCDTSGNIYIAVNFFSKTIDIGGFMVSNHDTMGISTDILVAKYDAGGNVVWAQCIGGSRIETAKSITVTPAGSVYVAGSFNSPSIQFGSATIGAPFQGMSRMCIFRCDRNGNPVWAESAGRGLITANGLVSTKSGDVYLVGDFYEDSLTISNASILKPTSGNIPSAYLVKFDSSNNVTWCRGINALGSGFNSSANGLSGCRVAVGACGSSVWITGSMSDSVSISNTVLHAPVNSFDPVYIAGYSSDGKPIGSIALQSGGDDANGIACDANGNIYSVSDFYTTLTAPFIIGNDTLKGTNGTLESFYIAKYSTSPVADTVYRFSDTPICQNSVLTLSAPLSYNSYRWNNGATSQSVQVNNAGKYWVYCFSNGICSGQVLIDTINVLPDYFSFSLGPDTTVCEPIVLQVQMKGVSFLWQDGSIVDSFHVSQSGTYSLTINKSGCSFTDSIAVTVIDLAQGLGDVFVCNETPIEMILSANVPQGGAATWSTGAATAAARISDTGRYWFTVTDQGCFASDTFSVIGQNCDCWMVVPKAFTPNDDGKNDFFKPIIEPNCKVTNYRFAVYNRWGEEVFMSTDPAQGWNGKLKGVNADLGVYGYIVRYEGGVRNKTHEKKGNVTLVR